MKERSAYGSYIEEMIRADIIGRPLVCSMCAHDRSSHGTLEKRLLTCDAMPEGGNILAEMVARERAEKKRARFATAVEKKPVVGIEDIIVGDGAAVVAGSEVLCLYSAFLAEGMVSFERRMNKDDAFQFTMGASQVVPGWEMGLAGVRVGGKRRLRIPPELAFRAQEVAGKRNAAVIFDIEIIAVMS